MSDKSHVCASCGVSVNTYDKCGCPPMSDNKPICHHWTQQGYLMVCKDCGIVQRKDGKNMPCPGKVKVAMRDNKPSAREVAHEAINRLLESDTGACFGTGYAPLVSILSDFEKEVKRETVERCIEMIRGFAEKAECEVAKIAHNISAGRLEKLLEDEA